MRNFGFSDYDTVIELGTNAKMSELSAAMGLTSLESLDDFVAANSRNHLAYARGLADVPGMRLRPYEPGEAAQLPLRRARARAGRRARARRPR